MTLSDDEILRQLRATFKVEANEHIQTMNRNLLALEREPAGEERDRLLEDIFRAAHSLKGAAGAADLDEVEETAHKLESVFSAARNEEIELTPDLCDVLYEAIDAVSTIIEAALEDAPHGLALPDLYARLDAAREGRVIPGPTPSPSGPEATAGATSEHEAEGAPAAEPAVPTMAPVATSTPPARAMNAGEEKREDAKASARPQSGPATAESDTRRNKGGKPRPLKAASGIEETVRVATNKLDSLMTQAGELLVAGLRIHQRVEEVEEVSRAIEDWNREWIKVRATYRHLVSNGAHEDVQPLLRFLELNQQRLKTLAIQVSNLRRGFASDALHLSRVTNDLGEEVMKVRMLPVSTVFNAFPRLVRDLARERGKEVDLQIEGEETELDRKVLEEIKDPLIHILRNSVDHGIETPEERVRAGKPRRGTIVISAFQKGSNIVIEVSDDGAGINLERVKQAALKAGLISAEDLETIGDEEAMRLIFAPGLSTSPTVTDISGRGVGMDVVRKNIEALHGHIDVDSTPGQGTKITLTLPLTLATTQVLLVQVEDQTYGIPISAVERIQRIQQKDISTVEGQEAILVDDEPVSLVYLSDVLEMPRQEEKARPEQRIPVVILRAGRRRIAFLVDAVVGQQEIVVKSLGRQLSRVRNVAGATILGTGQVMMILNPSDLIKSALLEGRPALTARATQSRVKETRRPTVLVVDDSLTTRTLERNILETAGYQVKVATDGVEALSILQSNGCDVVVSDILMPRMDGFELTAAIRSDPKLKDIPVVLVTSLESREDKERGIEVGADAYIVKSTFDQQDLLQTIERLV